MTTVIIIGFIIIIVYYILNNNSNDYMLYSERIDNIQASYVAESIINIVKSGNFNKHGSSISDLLLSDSYVRIYPEYLNEFENLSDLYISKESDEKFYKNGPKIKVQGKYKNIRFIKSVYFSKFNRFYENCGTKSIEIKKLKDNNYMNIYNKLYNYNIDDYNPKESFNIISVESGDIELLNKNTDIGIIRDEIKYRNSNDFVNSVKNAVIINKDGKVEISDNNLSVFIYAGKLVLHTDVDIRGVIIVRDSIEFNGNVLKVEGGFYNLSDCDFNEIVYKDNYSYQIKYASLLPEFNRHEVIYISP